ncbi:PHP domain-containing protein [Vallitalea pronyensis]|uniref:PHP domain-containing protein n=1 Tax=Vallitalea pronyensis TaxID=1348613 RepID=A0A8J8MHW8_9FIRM|nr:PHP domain-containing protein [Vallitalea pronyensis]QUI21950.1 PHP domain-containing protein [Vallitalea pronyensis]
MPVNLKRFNDLTTKDFNVDYHLHTDQTDGLDTIEEMIKKARAYHIAEIAFTEHVRKDTMWFDAFADRVRESADRYSDIKIYVGCETKVLDRKGNLDVSDKVLYRSDIVLGSVHRIPNGKGGFFDFATLTPQALASIELELAIKMLEKSPIDVLAHPGGMYSSRYGGYPIGYLKEMMITANAYDKAIELNSKYIKNTFDFMRVCGEINPKISIGSDAHQAENIGSCTKLISQLYNWGKKESVYNENISNRCRSSFGTSNHKIT